MFLREDHFHERRTMKFAVIFCLITLMIFAANGKHERNDDGGKLSLCFGVTFRKAEQFLAVLKIKYENTRSFFEVTILNEYKLYFLLLKCLEVFI